MIIGTTSNSSLEKQREKEISKFSKISFLSGEEAKRFRRVKPFFFLKKSGPKGFLEGPKNTALNELVHK